MTNNTFAFTGLIGKEGKRYWALCPELDVASDGSTIPEARKMLLEAVTLYLESAIESNLPYLRPVPADEDPRQAEPKSILRTFPLKVSVSVRAYA